jgi:hypothetical protein
MKKVLSVRLKIRKTHLNGVDVVVGAILAVATLNVLPASAQLSEGTLSDYTLVGLGSGPGTTTTFGWNSGPVSGNALFGNYETLKTSGGGGGGLSNGGVLSYDATTICSPSPCGSGLNTPPPTMSVSGPTPSSSVTGTALSEATTLSTNAAALTPNQTYTGTISSPTTFTAAGAQTVIDVDNIHNALLTFSGGAKDIFVVNVSGEFQTNVAMTLSGGVTASDILFNFTGTSGQVLNTSGGNVLYGTYLATDGGQFQFSALDLTGQLINVDGNVQLVPNSMIPIFAPFTPPSTIPEPSTWAMMLLGFAGLGYVGYRRRAAIAIA